MNKSLKILGLFLSSLTLFSLVSPPKVSAYSVCGLEAPEATFKTESYLITICRGEASYQMIITYYDGTGYKRIPAEVQGQGFRGSDSEHNYIIDSQKFILGTDGEPPVREKVLESQTN